jgi:hypothetical protein
MGAYYAAVIKDELYEPWTTEDRAKLAEHSYIGNPYVETIMDILYNNPQPLVWLCDYHKPDETTELTWENVEHIKYELAKDRSSHYYVLNHSQKMYIDMAKLSCSNISLAISMYIFCE